MNKHDEVDNLRFAYALSEARIKQLEGALDVANDALNRVYDSGVQLYELEAVVRAALGCHNET